MFLQTDKNSMEKCREHLNSYCGGGTHSRSPKFPAIWSGGVKFKPRFQNYLSTVAAAHILNHCRHIAFKPIVNR